MDKIVIVGRGFVAGKFREALSNNTPGPRREVIMSGADITDPFQIRSMIQQDTPGIIINCAGKTGRPNIDWCEDPENRASTWASNVFGPLVLAKECLAKNIYLVHIGSGCIYEGDNGGKGFSEVDPPNFSGSFYSRTKIEAERSLSFLSDSMGANSDSMGATILQLRLRMPLDGIPSDRNLITKITRYRQVISVQNSVSVMDDFFKAAITLINSRESGIFNVVNPGSISHEEILEMYSRIVDPSHSYEHITVKQLEAVTIARRSNCVLNTSKVEKLLAKSGVAMREVHEAVEDAMNKYKDHVMRSTSFRRVPQHQ